MIIPPSRKIKKISPRRCEIISLMIGAALLLILIMGNAIYQNVHCGTPLDKIDGFALQPCEPEGHLRAEIERWQRLARECPAR